MQLPVDTLQYMKGTSLRNDVSTLFKNVTKNVLNPINDLTFS